MQIRQRIFKHTAMKILYFFSRQTLQTFDLSHAFLPLTIAKLSMFKNGPVFLAHPVCMYVCMYVIDGYMVAVGAGGVLWQGNNLYSGRTPLWHKLRSSCESVQPGRSQSLQPTSLSTDRQRFAAVPLSMACN